MMSVCVLRQSVFVKKFIYYHGHFIRHYAKIKLKSTSKDAALSHFDNFYGSTFENWTSIRLGLLCPHSYCAVVNSFSNPDNLSEMFEELGAYNMRDMYDCKVEEREIKRLQEPEKPVMENVAAETENIKEDISKIFKNVKEETLNLSAEENVYIQPTKLISRDETEIDNIYTSFYDPDIDYNPKFDKENIIKFPIHLDVYLFPRGKFKEFPPPNQDATGLLNYYLMDASSILPVLALDVQEKEEVGDLCSAPGGKSLAVIFGLKFGKIICNDVGVRMKKLKTVFDSYIPHVGEWNKRILISKMNVLNWTEQDIFDKILLDVPCTNDRLSVTRDGNNIFKPHRFNERMTLPKTQTYMLCNALQALKVGGSLVYSTCSLSPIQNDGVVHIALSKLSTEVSKQFVVQDLSEAFYPVEEMFQFSNNCHYGKLVIPFLPLNYGPMYICKIKRVK